MSVIPSFTQEYAEPVLSDLLARADLGVLARGELDLRAH